MKAAELRIGNWVTIDNPEAWPELKGIPMVVVSIEKEEEDEDFPSSSGAVRVTIGRQYYSQFDEFIQPILLTEEWLLKFGFYFESNIECRLAELRLIWDVEDDGWYLWTNTVCMGYESHAESIGRPLKYVHQLQNLYFALEGEDLTITEQ